jgi:very-short-patch-repair endonuclease
MKIIRSSQQMARNIITETLASKEEFLPILEHFIERSIQEEFENSDDHGPISYFSFYQKFLPQIAHRSFGYIYEYSQSPIEKIFLSSLLLLAVKNRMPCLHITPPMEDALELISAFREKHMLIMKLVDSYKEVTGDENLVDFEASLNEKVISGSLPKEAALEIQVHENVIKHFEWNSYHFTLQAGLPHIKVDGRPIRVDLLIWVPGDESIKIVIECDGFAYHSSKETFQKDRIRDRVLQMNGYRVLRFSGAEINKDPAKISSEVLDLLDALDKNEHNNRVL